MEEEIKTLKEQEQRANGTAAHAPDPVIIPAPPSGKKNKNNHRPHRRHRPSLFGPLLLIGLGAYFLLRNMGYPIELNWWALWQAWPLFLILIGLKIIGEQAESGLLRGLANLARLGGFALLAGLLFFGHQMPFVGGYLPQAQTDEVRVLLEGREAAVVEIEFSTAPAELSALDDSPYILEGLVSYVGSGGVDVESLRGTITLETRDNTGFTGLQLETWQLGLHPAPALDLGLDLSTGSAQLDLGGLNLSALEVDGSTGATTLILPDGNYTAEYDGGTGAIVIHLPASGAQTINMDGGTGSITFYLPPQTEAQFTVSQGTGGFTPTSNLELVSGPRQEGTAIWQTAGFDEDAADRIIVMVDRGTGSVQVVPASGR